MRKKMTTKSKDELLEIYRLEYQEAGRKRKNEVLNTIVEATGLSRKHVIAALRQSCEKVDAGIRGRKPLYDDSAIEVLVQAWEVSGRICSKRLVPFLPEILFELEKSGMVIKPETQSAIAKMSARTVDRRLKAERQKDGRSLCTTKRSNLVKSKVPIRTFTEWDGVKPGFFETDTVSHCSSSSAGSYLSTLNMTDIATGWTEVFALARKGAAEVIAGFEKGIQLVPFPILGLDSDNGKEFLNECVIDWCERNQVTYTRSREYKKNDQAWVEQKNRSVVRKHVGRERFEGMEAWRLLSEFYALLRLYVNFFQPCQKLLFKKRIGAKTYKKHDLARPPYQRVIENEYVSDAVKDKLKMQRSSLSMVQIHAELVQREAELKKLAVDAPVTLPALIASQRMSTYKFIDRPIPEPQKEELMAVKPCRRKSTKPILPRIRNRILTFTNGEIFSAKAFDDLANRSTVDTYLCILKKQKLIAKVAWGRYQLLPEQHRQQIKKKYPKKRRASVR